MVMTNPSAEKTDNLMMTAEQDHTPQLVLSVIFWSGCNQINVMSLDRVITNAMFFMSLKGKKLTIITHLSAEKTEESMTTAVHKLNGLVVLMDLIWNGIQTSAILLTRVITNVSISNNGLRRNESDNFLNLIYKYNFNFPYFYKKVKIVIFIKKIKY